MWRTNQQALGNGQSRLPPLHSFASVHEACPARNQDIPRIVTRLKLSASGKNGRLFPKLVCEIRFGV